MEEATALARGGFLPASRALLENTGRCGIAFVRGPQTPSIAHSTPTPPVLSPTPPGEEHRCKALYWAARARLEEEQEGEDWDRAADLLEVRVYVYTHLWCSAVVCVLETELTTHVHHYHSYDESRRA